MIIHQYKCGTGVEGLAGRIIHTGEKRQTKRHYIWAAHHEILLFLDRLSSNGSDKSRYTSSSSFFPRTLASANDELNLEGVLRPGSRLSLSKVGKLNTNWKSVEVGEW